MDGEQGDPGTPGDDGYSPAVTITQITNGHRVTITDKTHQSGQTFDVMDGEQGDPGTPGDDGYSPAVTITTITGGHRVTITDKTHPSGQTFDVMDGVIQSVNGKSAASITLDSGDIEFDDSVTYAAGSIGAEVSDAKNAIDEKAPVIINSASGDIASFHDGADGMPIKHLVANIEAVQDGSGDPSPTNVRPITGWAGLTGARTGKNLLNTSAVTSKTANGITMTVNKDSNGSTTLIVLNGTATASFSFSIGSAVLAPGSYVFNALGGGVGTLGTLYVNYSGIVNAGSSDVKATLTETKTTNASISITNGTVVNNVVFYPMIRRAEEDATYEPYQPIQQISVNWQSEAGTVYGGTVDVVTGKLTVDRAIYTFTGSESTYVQQSGRVAVKCVSGDMIGKGSHDAICSMFVAVFSGEYAYIYTSMTAEELQTYFASNNVQIVYELYTPQTYQLDPIAVNTLLGNNTVYVDCGSVTVDYPADTGIVVAEQSNAISQLESEVVTDVTVTGTDVTIVAQANKRYLCGTVSTIAVTPCATGAFDLIFTSGSSAAILTIPSTVKWQDTSFDPTALDTDTIYEISVADGTLGLVAKWT